MDIERVWKQHSTRVTERQECKVLELPVLLMHENTFGKATLAAAAAAAIAAVIIISPTCTQLALSS